MDEAGRGPLAGPVVAGAVVLMPDAYLPGLDDSKRLTAAERERQYEAIQSAALAIGVGIVGERIIDSNNILEATRMAMMEALRNLPFTPDYVLIDAVRLPLLSVPQEPIIHGDRLSLSIAAASVIAKVTRDRIMESHHRRYPTYNFAKHKGYGTVEHRDCIRRYGPSPIHRLSFRGVKEWVRSDDAGDA